MGICTVDTSVPQHTMLQKVILVPSGDSISKRSTPSVSLKRNVRGSAAGILGFGGCPLSAHAGHANSRLTWFRTSDRARLRRRVRRNSSLLGCAQLMWIFWITRIWFAVKGFQVLAVSSPPSSSPPATSSQSRAFAPVSSGSSSCCSVFTRKELATLENKYLIRTGSCCSTFL